jgi:hypothetical protein
MSEAMVRRLSVAAAAIFYLFSNHICADESVSFDNHVKRSHLRSLLDANDFTSSGVHEISPSDLKAHHWFGSSVFMADHIAIVGAPGDSDYSKYGNAYIYRKTGGTWKEIKRIAPDSPSSDDGFGSAVSIYGGYAFVGAFKDDTGGTDCGAVYYFTEISDWRQEQKIVPSDGAGLDYFGSAIAQYRREELVVGAWGADYGGYTSCGAAYFYRYGDSQWNFEKKIVPDDTHSYQWFGISVSMFKSKAVIGAWGDSEGGSVSGAIYAYTHAMGSWDQIQKFNAQSSASHMGYSVSMYEDVMIIGLPNAYRTVLGTSNNPNAYRTGMCKVYRLMDYNHWELEQNIVCDDCDNLVAFGQSVSASKEHIVIGMHGATAVWTYDPYGSDGSKWQHEVNLYSANEQVDSSYFLGSTVSVYDNHVMVGVKDIDITTSKSLMAEEAGLAIIFESPKSKSSTNYIIQENLGLYVVLYVLIVLGIAVILIAPVALIGYNIYMQEKNANKLLEMKPFIKKTDNRAPTPLKKNPLSRPQASM